MSVSVGVGGAWKGLTGQWVGVSGAWRFILNEWVGVGGAWKLVHTTTLLIAVSPSLAVGTRGRTVTPATFVAVASGGSGSYTYAWTRLANSGPSQSALSPTSATTDIDATVSSGSPNSSGSWKCTVTDTATGLTADSATVTADIEYIT